MNKQRSRNLTEQDKKKGKWSSYIVPACQTRLIFPENSTLQKWANSLISLT